MARSGEAVLLDVTCNREFAAGHAGKVQHLDHADSSTARARSSRGRDDPTRPAVVATLEREGYPDVETIGRLKDWQAAGGPVAS